MTYVYRNDVKVHSYLIDQNSRCFSAIERESSGISFFRQPFFFITLYLSVLPSSNCEHGLGYLPSALCAFHTSSKPPEDLFLSKLFRVFNIRQFRLVCNGHVACIANCLIVSVPSRLRCINCFLSCQKFDLFDHGTLSTM